MKVTVTTENRFQRTPDGQVWTCAQYAYSFFHRYLDMFEQVEVVSRVQEVSSVPSNWKRADGPSVSFAPVPYYLGPFEYVQRRHEIARVLKRTAQTTEAVILRAASPLSNRLGQCLYSRVYPFGVEVIGDPWEFFTPGSVSHPLRPFFRILFSRQLATLCSRASGVAYVTREALQRRYPASRGAVSASYSDVELPNEAFASHSPERGKVAGPRTLISVGTLAQLYKAQDILISAVAHCVAKGLDLRLVLIGDGQFRAQLEAQARGLGLSGRVRFAGEVPSGASVRAELDQAHLFLLPSRSEGLPRAMIEAMARGLPCIGSTVGGIPELLSSQDLVPPNDVHSLANLIAEVVVDPERMVRMGARNLERAWQYHEDALRKSREAFYRFIREETERARKRSH